jgi:hypothetical protein
MEQDLIYATLLRLLPPNRKTTPSQWVSFNAVCCPHRGHRVDRRQRGGVLPNIQGSGFQYNCFNCGYKAGWVPGQLLSNNTKNLFKWLGLGAYEIAKLGLAALRWRDQINPQVEGSADQPLVGFASKNLPVDAQSLTQWIEISADNPALQTQITQVIEYVYSRGLEYDWYNWHWSPDPGYANRLIIPFYDRRQIVGWTARKITDEEGPKYLTSSQPGIVFNLDQQTQSRDRLYVIVVEGQLDAIAIDGVAIMHNQASDAQCARIAALNREVIIVPDRDAAGAKLLSAAVKQGWSASAPPWEQGIKDVADAVKRYGRLYVLTTILHYRVRGEIKIQMLKKQLERLQHA